MSYVLKIYLKFYKTPATTHTQILVFFSCECKSDPNLPEGKYRQNPRDCMVIHTYYECRQ